MPIEACYSAKASPNYEPLPLSDARRSALPSPRRESNGVRDELVVTYRKINTLTPFDNNARTHSRSQIRKLRDSIQAFGFVNPVLINTAGTIVAGHGRVQAAKLLGMTEVPTICLENLTPDEIRAYVIADNRLAEDAGWDEQILKIELQHLISLPDIDVSITGFEVPEIDLIIGSAPAEEDPDDQLPEEAAEVITKPGDLWCLGDHRIYCGDARSASSFTALMEERRAAVVFVDPPYNVAIDGHASGNGRIHHAEFAMASGEMSEAEFTEFLATSLSHLADWSTDGSVHFVAIDWRHTSELLAAGKRVYDSLLNLCVWNKNNGGMGSFYRSQHELIFVFKSGKGPHRNNVQLGKFGRNRTNVWDYPGANTLSRTGEEGNVLAMHPTVKPVALVADAPLDCSSRGDIVLDSFLGAGSTLLAAERIGRVCHGMEIEGRYVDLAIRRWQQLTGERAYKADTGVLFDDEFANDEVSRG
jgi:DNA modification methylase